MMSRSGIWGTDEGRPVEYGNIGDSPIQHRDVDHEVTVTWWDPELVSITRLRLLTDRDCPVWDVSYCYGRLRDGRDVRVSLPFQQLPKGRSINTRLYEQCVRAGVNGKRLGIYGAVSLLV